MTMVGVVVTVVGDVGGVSIHCTIKLCKSLLSSFVLYKCFTGFY
jgi:hypothetical protein